MDDLRRCWKVPYIVYFCNLFAQKLDLIDLRVDEFEEAIIDDCGSERNIVVVHLLQKLLKPFINRAVDLTTYEQFLLQTLKKYNLENLFLQNKPENQWSNLTMLTKTDIIYNLCELRLQLTDVETKLAEFEAADLRVEPLGLDSSGNKLWYFGDLRLYEEKAPEKKKKEKPVKKEKKAAVQAKSNGKKGRQTKAAAKKTAKPAAKKAPASNKKKPVETAKNGSKKPLGKAKEKELLSKSMPLSSPAANGRTRRSLAAAAAVVETTMQTRRSARNLNKTVAEVNSHSTRNNNHHQEEEEEDEEEDEEMEEENEAEDESDAEDEEDNEEEEEEEDEDEEEDENSESEAESEETPPPPPKGRKSVSSSTSKDDIKTQEVKIEVDDVNDTQPNDNDVNNNIKQEEAANEAIPPAKVEREELDEYKEELKNWRCVCLTLEDWSAVNERYKQSKKKVDVEIAKIIETNYLPEMPALFQKAERERTQRLLALAPKRQSQRLQTKQQVAMESGGESKTNNDSDMFDSNDESMSMLTRQQLAELNKLPPSEQERMRREEIARQRELRLRQREMRKEAEIGGLDENSQLSSVGGSLQSSSGTNLQASSDFNIRNYFLMHKVLNKLLQCKYAWPFKDPVTEEDAPNYSTIISQPMDLSTIQHRINNKTYKTRQAFIDDLELVVNNCLTYNGDDSFYGKLALKFENFFKRWLQIFYPREISTSLEEKNRQLMKLMQGGEGENNENNSASQNGGENGGIPRENGGEGDSTTMGDDQSGGGGDNRLLFDFSNDMMFDSSGRLMRKARRKHNPDRDKYIQEPQYVTKKTSSGRLVKMKISNDFDYTSDQEEEGKRRRRDEEEMEGIQAKHRKEGDDQYLQFQMQQQRHNNHNRHRTGSDNDTSSMSDGDSSGDEDFLGNKYRKAKHKSGSKPKRTYTRTPRPRSQGNSSARRLTVKELTESGSGMLFDDGDDESDDESSTSQDEFIMAPRPRGSKASGVIVAPSATSSTTAASGSNQFTFDQYVKKLSSGGSCTVGQALAMADAVKSAGGHMSPVLTSGARQLGGVTKISTTSSSTSSPKPPASLNVPIINPAIKTILSKLNTHNQPLQQQTPAGNRIILNAAPISASPNAGASSDNAGGAKPTVKLIAVNSSSASSSSNPTGTPVNTKKFLIINSSGSTPLRNLAQAQAAAAAAASSGSTTSPVTTTVSAKPATQMVKIINISQLNGRSGTSTSSSTSTSATVGTNSLGRPIIMINKPTIKTTPQIISTIQPTTTTATETTTTAVETPTTTTTNGPEAAASQQIEQTNEEEKLDNHDDSSSSLSLQPPPVMSAIEPISLVNEDVNNMITENNIFDLSTTTN